MCFVDTPGLGSVFTGNTATTQAFIPHIDAALVVVGADPPIAGEELVLVEAVGKQVQDLILVINKADRTTDPERAAAVQFTREVLEKRLHRPMGEVLEVSAAERMENRGPLRDWEKLLASLHHLVDDSGRNLVRAACDRGLQRLSEQLLAMISEDRDALQRPIEESERRIKLMKETISEAERSMRELNFLFMAEQYRISDLFLDRHKQFFRSASMESEAEFDHALASVPGGFGPHYRRRVMPPRSGDRAPQGYALAQTRAGRGRAPIQGRGPSVCGDGKQLSEKAGGRGPRRTNADAPCARFGEGLPRAFEVYFRGLHRDRTASIPLRWLADIFLLLLGARKVITNEAREFLRHLLEVNGSRVQNDVLNRIQESRDRLEVEIRKLLHEISRIAEQALDRARKVKEEGAPAVQSAIERLNRLEREVSALV